jgi:putative transposase
LGLTAGAVPPRVEAGVKAGLLDLIQHAESEGWSRARACRLLGLDPDRAADWQARQRLDRLEDLAPGGGAMHGLLEHERTAIVTLFETWAQIDRSHRKLAARGSRLELVHVAPSTVLRVLQAENLLLPGLPAREPLVRAPWPDWVVWKPNSIWCYDFTHFPRAKCCAVAVMDVVSRRWLTTLVSAEETSTQIEVAFLAALSTEGLQERIDQRLLAKLRAGEATAADLDGPDADGVPVLIVMSDNGPQMRSHSTKEFMAACAIMQRFGRPGTPTDQAWIESLFGHVKTEWPHLSKIHDAGELSLELELAREQYNTVRLHAGIGYVTPDDEHYGRGDALRQARRDGLVAARQARIAYRRSDRKNPS